MHVRQRSKLNNVFPALSLRVDKSSRKKW